SSNERVRHDEIERPGRVRVAFMVESALQLLLHTASRARVEHQLTLRGLIDPDEGIRRDLPAEPADERLERKHELIFVETDHLLRREPVGFHSLANAPLRGVYRARERLSQGQSLKARLGVTREAQQLLKKSVHAVDGLARQADELFAQAGVVQQLL